jgi:hypothetical protein
MYPCFVHLKSFEHILDVQRLKVILNGELHHLQSQKQSVNPIQRSAVGWVIKSGSFPSFQKYILPVPGAGKGHHHWMLDSSLSLSSG